MPPANGKTRPPIHVLPYGDFGAGKTEFAATFPWPQIIWFFDAFGKDWPYLKNPAYTVGDLKVDGFGSKYREVHSKKGTLIRRIEYYHDTQWLPEPKQIKRKAGVSVQDIIPEAYARYLRRMAAFQEEQDLWATGILDSVTSMEITARRWDQFILNPGAEDARQWYGASKDMLERMLMGRLAGLPMNVVVICHVDDEKFEHQGMGRRMPMAPGKLRAALPSQYAEVYRVYADAQGHYLQTRSDNIWAATTQIGAPNGCPPHYAALWETVDAGAAP